MSRLTVHTSPASPPLVPKNTDSCKVMLSITKKSEYCVSAMTKSD